MKLVSVSVPDWWLRMSPEQQRDYIKRHPKTLLKPEGQAKNRGLKMAGRDLTPPEARKARIAATAETKSILNRTSDENLKKLAADMKAYQHGGVLSGKAARTIGRLVGAAFGAAVTAVSFMTPFPEITDVAQAYAITKITGKSHPNLPNWLDEEARAERRAERRKKKTGLDLTDEEYEDPKLFREAMTRVVNENLPKLNPKVAKILIEQRKRNLK